MSQHNDDFELSTTEISVMEDLDAPDLPAGEGMSHRREFVLGGVLVLVVLLWAFLQLWSTEGKRESYRQAGEAAEMKRWDQARTQYIAASGYKDADARAAEVARTIAERDRHYKAALEYAREGEWARALLAAREVLEIEPDYLGEGDIPALKTKAEEHVYRDALAGAVALREQAQPPGLYYRGDSGWVYLEGSDRWSRVLGVGPSSHVIYDVPGVGWRPSATFTPGPDLDSGDLGSPNLKGRRAVAASLGEKVGFAPLSLDPAEHDFFIWGEQGTWAFHDGNGTDTQSPGPPIRQPLFYGSADVHYQRFDRQLTGTLNLDGMSLMDVSRDGTRVLLADWGVGDENVVNIKLYVADGDGGNPRLLYAHSGGFVSAQLSPDARYVLLTTYSPIYDNRTETQTTVLLDTEGKNPPHTLAEGMRNEDMRFRFLVTSTFLSGGAYDGWVALVQMEGSYNVIKLINSDDPDGAVTGAKVAGPMTLDAAVTQPDDRGVLFYGQGNYGGSQGMYGGSLIAVSIDRTGQYTVSTLRSENATSVLNLIFPGNYVAYSAQEDIAWADGRFAVYSYPLSELGKDRGEPTQVYTGTLSDNYAVLNLTVNLGPNMLAHTEDGVLHARTYDGKVDVTLESGLRFFYNSALHESYWRRLR